MMNAIVLPILTGLLITFLSWPINKYLDNTLGKKEYNKKVEKAKKEIVRVLTDYVISFKTIDIKIVNQVILATCIENNINSKDVYNLEEVKSILVKKIMELRFIQDSQRTIIINEILNNINLHKITNELNEDIIEVTNYNISEEQKTTTFPILQIAVFVFATIGLQNLDIYNNMSVMREEIRIMVKNHHEIVLYMMYSFIIIIVTFNILKKIRYTNSYKYFKRWLMEEDEKEAEFMN